MILGVNVDTNAGPVPTAEQCSAVAIGGTNCVSTFIAVGGRLFIAGVVGVTLVGADASAQAVEALPAPIEISVVPTVPSQVSAADLRDAYEHLRRQMAIEGTPFLNATELEREIADRKGTRS